MDDALTLLRRMVEIESLSSQEGELARFLVEWMARVGFGRVTVDEAGNAVGEVGSGSHTVVLLGHMDAVPGRIPVRIEDGNLYGRGSVDAKGPLAAFIVAAARAAESLRHLRIIVVGAVEEEAATSKGARYIGRRMLEEGVPQACIIGEPSGWDGITLGYKGRLLVEFSAEQPGGHTAGPLDGVCESAIHWWLAVKSLADRFNGDKSSHFEQLHPSLRRLHSESDGLSDRVEATVGLRVPFGYDLERLQREVEAAAATAGGTARAYGKELPYRSEKNTPLARALIAAIRAQDGQPRFKMKTGTSDMNVVGPEWGCPIVAYGPGDSRLDHTPDEHIEIAEYRRSIAVLVNVLQRLDGEFT